MDARFICWTDSHGNRGFIPQSTPHSLKKIGSILYFEAQSVVASIAADADIFMMSKEEQAMAFVKTGATAGKLAETCAEKGV